jgi:hypothetical protein
MYTSKKVYEVRGFSMCSQRFCAKNLVGKILVHQVQIWYLFSLEQIDLSLGIQDQKIGQPDLLT